MKGIDLHLHTTASDGSNRPEEVVQMAAAAELRAIAITDHDNTRGIRAAMLEGERRGVEVVPGIELSTAYLGMEVHILGYYIDPAADSLADLLTWALTEREQRNRRIVAVLQQAGVEITMEEVREKFPDTVLGRPHLGMVMAEKGYVQDVRQAFREYLGKGGRCYIPKVNQPVERAVERILQAGGLPVLAHPYQYELDEPGLRKLISHMKGLGCVGMECVYSKYTPEQSQGLLDLAEEYGLIPTGGSDYHGLSKPDIHVGDVRAPYGYLEQLKAARQ